MSYGTNAPAGLQAIRTQTDASWSGKVNTYQIASGYANNIGIGDLVTLNPAGFIVNYSDYTAAPVASAAAVCQPILGVFNGLLVIPSGVQAFNTQGNASQPYFAAGTTSNQPIYCSVIVDPNVVYTIQVGTGVNQTGMPQAGAATQGNVGGFASVAYQFSSGGYGNGTVAGTGVVAVNPNGTSSMYLAIDSYLAGNPNPTTATNLNVSFFIDGITNYQNNVSGLNYNNVDVMIAFHRFRFMYGA